MRENELLKNITEEMKTHTRSNWTKTNLKYAEAFGIADDMQRMTRQELVKKARQLDSERWNEEVQNKTSLTLYREWKNEVKEDLVYDNRPSSIILFKARTATLPLNDRKRHIGQSTECDLCGSELENTEHFLLECTDEEITEERRKATLLQRPMQENQAMIIGKFLFEPEEIEVKKDILYNMWKARKRRISLKQANANAGV